LLLKNILFGFSGRLVNEILFTHHADIGANFDELKGNFLFNDVPVFTAELQGYQENEKY
jgi:hypothetical protein